MAAVASDGLRKPSKRKRKAGHAPTVEESADGCLQMVDVSAKKRTKNPAGRNYTVTIAVAGSVIDNAQSLELATSLAGQIARAAVIFRVDEIVVFDDGDANSTLRNRRWSYAGGTEETGGAFLARILQYLETPQYLRKALFPVQPSLRFAGLLPPLDTPHHARKHEWVAYREGFVLANQGGDGSTVDVGLAKEVVVTPSVPPGTRVTVAMGENWKSLGNKLQTVPSSFPREVAGLYWGYSVRHVRRLSAIFENCPFADGYDYRIGTSEHGTKEQSSSFKVPRFRHLLVVYGGPPGLEESKSKDKSITTDNVASLFDRYINVCPSQGSRTIRTEEAILIALQYLQDPIWRAFN